MSIGSTGGGRAQSLIKNSSVELGPIAYLITRRVIIRLSLIKKFLVELGPFDDLRQTKRYFSTSNTFEGGVTEKDK